MIRRIPSKQRNAPVARQREQGALLRLGLLLFCGLTLAGGFVYAGGQHFAALRMGYETENLRRVRDQLAEDQRRYLLEREAAASPVRLERAARQLGMQPLQPAQIDPLSQKKKQTNEKAAPILRASAQSSGEPSERQGKPSRQKNLDESSLH
ncbi:MAG: cell division protein FtsL [Acidobacteriota bacterium]